jgi:hypothetical protein
VQAVPGYFGSKTVHQAEQFKIQVRDPLEGAAQHRFESQVFVCLINSGEKNNNADL